MRSPPRASQLAGARARGNFGRPRPAALTEQASAVIHKTGCECEVPSSDYFVLFSGNRRDRTNRTRTPKPVHGLSELFERSPAVRMHARDTARTTFCIGGVRGPVAPTFSRADPPPLRPRCDAAFVDFGSLGFAISQLRFHCSLALGYNNYSAKFKLTVIEFA